MPANVNISGTESSWCSESDISINPVNPSQIICASNTVLNQAQFWSSDGGATWQNVLLQLVLTDVNHTDPAVGWTTDGTAWAVVLGIGTSDLVTRVYKSTDGGATWNFDSTPSGAQTDTDRETFWVDRSPSSPNTDNMYIIWHNGGPCYVVSRPGPGGTWGAPIQVSQAETTGSAVGADIKTNGNGDVLAFWPDTGSSALYFAKSTNGGGAFSAPTKISDTFGSFKIPIPAQDVREAAIYVSGGGYSGGGLNKVYACWNDLAGGAGCNAAGDAPGSDTSSTCKTRIWFAQSDDGGTTWQPPIKINDQNSLNDQFFPRLAIDDTTGNLMVVYYDTVDDPNRLKTDVWMQCSVDNGATWTQAVKITSAETDEATSNDDDGNQYGDYVGLSGYDGQYFACWTDRRNGGNEQIWGSAIAIPSTYFIDVKNSFGEDEVNDSHTYNNDFYVAVEGASPNSLGSATPAFSNALSTISSITISPNTSAGPLPFPTLEFPAQLDTPQRILFPYNVSFPTGAQIPPFPMSGSPAVTKELDSSISFQGFQGANSLTAQTLFEFVAGGDPYFRNINPVVDNEFYLSNDLRVFTITPGVPALSNGMPGAPAFTPSMVGGSPVPLTSQDPAAAYQYIQSLLSYLNSNYNDPSGADPFASFMDQGNALTADSTVSPGSFNPLDIMHPWTNYNFGVARVWLSGNAGDSAQTKVFFRLFIAQTSDTDYQTASTYPSNLDMANLPASPLPGPGNQTYPFFATGDYSAATETSDYGATGANNQNITVGASGGTWAYFGCFLNVYDSTIQGAVMAAGSHQCLVAQIACDDAPIINTSIVIESPENSDKLAQRNLQISFSDNPGPASTHRVPQSFDTRPSPAVTSVPGNLLNYPDELMISWGNTPAGSLANIYWPGVDASTVLELASQMYAANFLSASDPHTLQCRVSGNLTYVPIPPGTGNNFAGLFTINLPQTVVTGQEFNITVRRIATRRGLVNFRSRTPQIKAIISTPGRTVGNWRYIVGTFQVRIPVVTKEIMLWPDENMLAIFKWRLQNMSSSNRWYPVLQRYIGIIAGRIQGLGGNPGQIGPSPSGYIPSLPGHVPGEECREFTGKVVGIVYDRFGDFRGFRLVTEKGHEHSFHGREREMESLIYRAWLEEILITVVIEGSDHHWPNSIIYRA
ncbi:MAG: sialidase family protein [Candidatus Sulfotelmatobacter sp.]